jgi:hypothetical protein
MASSDFVSAPCTLSTAPQEDKDPTDSQRCTQRRRSKSGTEQECHRVPHRVAGALSRWHTAQAITTSLRACKRGRGEGRGGR